ncbi:F0F1 ATP synthase subunit gamma [Leuconostoc lactis]|uniref:F0F1 ATP synthase subunit gamma n=1 Tax=Leuconostoc lactis TaxID=1246 RepID=UPI00351EF0B5
MASLQDIQRRISSTKKTRQITSAMQMVSTAKLNQIQRYSAGYQAYAARLEAVVEHLVSANLFRNADAKHIPLIAQRPIKKTGILVVTSDRGLVGSYNANIIKQTNALLARLGLDQNNTVILAVGGNGADFYKKRGFNVILEHHGVSDIPSFNEIRSVVRTVTSLYETEVFDALHVVYNHFVNRLTSEYRDVQLLPLTGDTLDAMGGTDAAKAELDVQSAYEIEPDTTAVLNVVLPQFAQSLVYEAVLDAKTAEHAASSTAMKSATDNAKDLISGLELQFNRARQAAITTEITEITGGMAALE